MSHKYHFRSHERAHDDPTVEEPEASSSPGPQSSPDQSFLINNWNIPNNVPFLDISALSEDEVLDPDYVYTSTNLRKPRLTNLEKVLQILAYIKTSFPRFSLRLLQETLFDTNDPTIKNWSNIFLADGGHVYLMDLWWNSQGSRDEKMKSWIVEKAAEICSKEASFLTDRASVGPHMDDAAFLRVSAKEVDVAMVNGFRLRDLTARYERTLPHLQCILKAIIGKDGKERDLSSRDPDAGRTMITSMALNLRSRRVTYHPLINALTLWDNRVPKRLVQALNHFGITTSYPFQSKAIMFLSKNSLLLARQAANDATKVKMLPYDNFNWTARAWESTALHASVTHDEVSALLTILQLPDGPGAPTARHLTNLARFAETLGTRHQLPAHISLAEIMPTSPDQKSFRANIIIHVMQILSEEIKSFAQFSSVIPAFEDFTAIPPRKTEEFYLPTFDQEQGSTRGNMVVLGHYFGKVLKIPKETFEHTMFTVLGDRLTTVRDRAAQDQRAVDRSAHHFDHLSSLSMLSGLMHLVLNFIQAKARNAWGTKDAQDPVSLLALRDVLPNRADINLRKVDYYGWLRFLDVILRSLVIRASMVVLKISTTMDFSQLMSPTSFHELASNVTDQFILPPISRLEANGQKTMLGSTESGHAVSLAHDLMTIREMQHAVKHGHPGRIRQMIKYWTPMFYAAGSYNYANECMELLHNVTHDWPQDFAAVAFNGMLVNPAGKAGGFKPTDIRVEHLNDKIKERAHGSNATPDILEKTTLALGHVQQLTDQLYEDLGVEYQNQLHAKVSQHKDVELMVKHLVDAHIYDWAVDKKSTHAIIELYRIGCLQLAGPDGGHAKHLARHKQRLRTRHSNGETLDKELVLSADSERVEMRGHVIEHVDDLREVVTQAGLQLGRDDDD